MANTTKLKFRKVEAVPTSGMTTGEVIFCKSDHTIYVATGATTKEAFYGGNVKSVTSENSKLIFTFMDGSTNLEVDFSSMNTALATLQNTVTDLDGRVTTLEENQGPNLVEGKDIHITTGKEATPDNPQNAINVSLDDDITVIGVSVGTLANGAKLTAGMSLSEILKKILIREIDAKVGTKPTTGIGVKGVTSSGTYEVGTSLTATLSHSYTDGTFVGADSQYSYNQKAGCTEGATTYKYDDTAVTSPYTLIVTEGSHKFNCQTAYGANTNTPVKNNGTNSSVTIPAGTATSNNFPFTGKFYGYVGYSTKTAGSQFDSASIKALAATKQYLTIDGNTTLLSGGATSNGTSIIIAVPAKYKLAGIQNSLGVSIIENFDTPVEVNYTNGTTTTTYKVYVYPITSGAKVAYKNVVISKA